MHLNIENYVIKYHKYMVHKAQWLKVIVVLHPLDIPNNTWESISMDFIVSLPCTHKGHDVIFIPMKFTVTTQDLANQLVNELV